MSDGERAGSLDALLEFIKETRGFDFTGFKHSSVERRLAKRMEAVGLETYEEYLDFLQRHAEEFAELFDALLVNVTGFFRDPPTWEYLATTIVPQLRDSRSASAPIRIWCAGCASGEEPYTVAMVMARVLGDATVRNRVKIYATDVDEHALEQARLGAYLPRQIEDIPHDALDRFFERSDQRYVFRPDLRRCVAFGRNDLMQDPPISRIDLLVCRNTLMYFTADTRAEILRRFHFALDDGGVLLLGKSETLVPQGDIFTPIENRWRAFRKVLRAARRERARVTTANPTDGVSLTIADTLRAAAFDATGSAQVVLDAGGALVMANDLARRRFGLGVHDFGRPIEDLEMSYHPVALRAHLHAMSRDPRAVEVKSVRWRLDAQDTVHDVRLAPLMDDGVLHGTSIAYVDVTDSRKLEEQLASAERELEQAYEELQSTVEELETSHAELHSTVEELERVKDELDTLNDEAPVTE